MRKVKRFLAMVIVVLLLVPTLAFPVNAAEAQKTPQFQNNPFTVQAVKQLQDEKNLANFITKYSSDRPFSAELLAHFLCGGGDKTYWEEEVPEHIKDEIFSNEKIQEKLQYVLQRAYSNGSWKVIYTFNDETPQYYDSNVISEKPFVDKAGLLFTSHDLSTSIAHINGRLVIGADYLGNNEFSVWLSLSDLYDYSLDYDYEGFGFAANVMAILQKLNLARPFNLTIGFTRPYTWAPPVQTAPTPPPSITVEQTTQPPSQPSSQPPSQPSSSSQFYARGNYDIGNYTGEMLQGKPHGYGTLEYNNQTKYEIGMPDGSWFKATKYTGNWVNGVRCGQGTFTFANGVQYEGVWNTDGYYFKGYVKSGALRQYIEQTASGDTITTVYSGAVERIG